MQAEGRRGKEAGRGKGPPEKQTLSSEKHTLGSVSPWEAGGHNQKSAAFPPGLSWLVTLWSCRQLQHPWLQPSGPHLLFPE